MTVCEVLLLAFLDGVLGGADLVDRIKRVLRVEECQKVWIVEYDSQDTKKSVGSTETTCPAP